MIPVHRRSAIYIKKIYFTFMQQRITRINPENTTGTTKELLDAVKGKLGGIPNTFATMASSPSALGGYLGLMMTLEKGKLTNECRNQISILVSELNKCPYCLSAFTALGKGAGMDDEGVHMCRLATSTDPKISAALTFVKTVMEKRGQVSDADVTDVRKAGYGDEEIGEMIASIALYTFINYFNIVAKTEIDFPLVTPGV